MTDSNHGQQPEAAHNKRSRIAWIILGCLAVPVVAVAALMPSDDEDATAEERATEETDITDEDEDEAGEEDDGEDDASKEDADALPYEVTREYSIATESEDEIWIRFDLEDHFTGTLMASQAQRTAAEALQDAHSEHPDGYRYVVEVTNPESDSPVSNAAFDPDTMEQMDFDDPTLNVFNHLDAGSAHPDLID